MPEPLRASSAIRAASPSAAKLPGTSRTSASAPSLSPRPSRIRASGTAALRVRGLELDRLAQRLLVALGDQLLGLGGQQRVEEARRRSAGGWAPTNSAATLPSLNALTAGMLWIRYCASEVLVGVGVELDELDRAAARGDRLLEHRTQLAARAAPFGPEVDDDRERARSAR